MTYDAATAYLLGTINETLSRRSPTRLDRMEAFLAHLGDPHRSYPTIHVGGTSGKGSTATMIGTALTAAGKRTGVHTKPHLRSMTERARIDGSAIPEERFAGVLASMMPAIDETSREFGRPSYYETLLALAFAYFAQERVDVAVIEVGIGGKLDGTNLVTPDVSIVTNVGFDHMDVLGNTIESIATDKAGIVKPGVPLVSDATGVAREIIVAACERAGAPFTGVADAARIEERGGERYGQSFAIATADATYELSLPVLGRFQQRNAATAILALERLPPHLRPTRADVERGFSQLVIPGRMEFFPGFPAIVFDVAHNPDKAASLANALRETFPEKRFAIVVAIAETKDASNVLRPLLELPATFIMTSFETPGRTAERPLRLANIAERSGISARVIGDPVEALAIARRQGDGSHVVVVTGSTFVTAVLREWWLENVVESRR